MFVDETRHFLASVDRHAAPVVTLRDAAQSLRMALAAKESLEHGVVVTMAGQALAR
jgi:hypothetical protein